MEAMNPCPRGQHPMVSTANRAGEHEDPLTHSFYCPSCDSSYPKPTKFERNIEHDKYKGHDIRSHPLEVERYGKMKWKVRIDITLLNGNMREHLDEEQLYLMRDEAHKAGFELGYRLIDEEMM